jgi:hypothetical protein
MRSSEVFCGEASLSLKGMNDRARRCGEATTLGQPGSRFQLPEGDRGLSMRLLTSDNLSMGFALFDFLIDRLHLTG